MADARQPPAQRCTGHPAPLSMEYPVIMKAVWDGLNHAGKNYRQILKVRSPALRALRCVSLNSLHHAGAALALWGCAATLRLRHAMDQGNHKKTYCMPSHRPPLASHRPFSCWRRW